MKNKTSLTANRLTLATFFLLLLITSSLVAQVPQGIPYQAMIRGNDGAALENSNVTVRFTLHQNTTTGPVEYQETQALTTNAYGLINTQFGTGTPNQGTFAGIVWSNTSKFIQVEANDGNGYVDMGTQQMMSVPYAMYAGSAGQSIVPLGTQTGDMLYWDSASSTWTPLPSGTNGQALYNCEGVPTWGGCAPIVGNLTVSGITPYTAYAEFPMSSNGGNAPINIGFYLSTSINISPSNGQFLGGTWPGGGISNWINSNSASVPGGSGTVKSGNDGTTSISNLSPNTQYYLIGVVTNAKGTTSTPVLSFTTPVLVEGCMDINACNYNSLATFNLDCQYAIPGYNCDGTCATDADNDGICDIDDSFICNLDIDNDGVCDNNILIPFNDVDGCTDVNACNYNMHYIYESLGSTQCYYDTDLDGYCPVPDGYWVVDFEYPTFTVIGTTPNYNYSLTNLDFCQDISACNVSGNGDLFGTVLFQNDGDFHDAGLINSFPYYSLNPNEYLYADFPSIGSSGNSVSRFGCAYDTDNDGICDVNDKCHDVSACNYLNTSDEYCFPDTDNDGVCDNLDGCFNSQYCNYHIPTAIECLVPGNPCTLNAFENGHVDSECNCVPN